MTATRSRSTTTAPAAEASDAEETVAQAEAPEATAAAKKPKGNKMMKAGGAKAGGPNAAGAKPKASPAQKAKMRARKANAAAARSGEGTDAATPSAKPAAKQGGGKQQLVRDSFTIPKNEYHALDVLKKRAMGLQHDVRKGELLRAGLLALAGMTDASFLEALKAVPTLKPGRPKGNKAAGASADDDE